MPHTARQHTARQATYRAGPVGAKAPTTMNTAIPAKSSAVKAVASPSATSGRTLAEERARP